jgi:predicted PurR-regulated permease PerM
VQSALRSPAFRRRAFITLGAIALGLLVLAFLARIPRTLTVFVIAAFIAFGVAPIVGRLERRISRGAAIAIVYAGLIAIVVVLTLLIVPETLAQVQSIAINAPAYIAAFQGWIDSAQHLLASRFSRTYLPPEAGNLHGYIAGRISLIFSTLLSSFSQILFGAFTAAFIGVSALVLSAFFLLKGETVADPLYELLPAHRRATARALGTELAQVFGSYVSGQAALCAITGLLIFAFTLLAGFKFALLLGIVAGLAYGVPFVGMIVAHVVGLVLAAPQGVQTVVWVQIIVFTIARISDNLLVPKIMSESVGVSPIVVMFAVFAGGELFGLPGLLLGIPAAALAKVAWQFFRTPREVLPPQPLPGAESTAVTETTTTTIVVSKAS